MGLLRLPSTNNTPYVEVVSCLHSDLKNALRRRALLAALGGNESPSADDIKTILSSVGIDADDEKLGKVISELAGKSIADVIAAGNEKLASVPSGGGAVAA